MKLFLESLEIIFIGSLGSIPKRIYKEILEKSEEYLEELKTVDEAFQEVYHEVTILLIYKSCRQPKLE